MMQELCPPNPSELLRATRTARCLALRGTKSRSGPHAGSGSSRLMVGGMMPLLRVMTQAISSTAAVAPSMWPRQLLVELMASLGAWVPNTVRIAVVSATSLSSVPVPWALM